MPIGVSLEPIEAVLFDVDGTLVDSVGGLVLELSDTFAHHGNPRSHDEIRALIGVPLHQQMRFAIGPDATPEQILEGIDFTISRYAYHQAGALFFEPAVQALVELKQAGIKIALVTSKNALEMEAFWPKFTARDFVDVAICASDVINPKPSGEPALLACERLGVSPSRAVMIGDSIFDLRCAKEAGIASIAVSYGSTDTETLMLEEPNGRFDTPEALLAWVRESIFYDHEKENDQYTERTG